MSEPLNKSSVKLFISYAHKNRVWMEHLKPLLSGFKYDDRVTQSPTGLNFVHAWHDNELTAGNPWDDKIRRALDEMDIYVPLVSMDFLASEYIQEVELKRAKERDKASEILVVPILLYDVNLRDKYSFLYRFKALPSPWWSYYPDPCTAHRAIDDGLWEAIKEVKQRIMLAKPQSPALTT